MAGPKKNERATQPQLKLALAPGDVADDDASGRERRVDASSDAHGSHATEKESAQIPRFFLADARIGPAASRVAGLGRSESAAAGNIDQLAQAYHRNPLAVSAHTIYLGPSEYRRYGQLFQNVAAHHEVDEDVRKVFWAVSCAMERSGDVFFRRVPRYEDHRLVFRVPSKIAGLCAPPTLLDQLESLVNVPQIVTLYLYGRFRLVGDLTLEPARFEHVAILPGTPGARLSAERA